MTLNISKCYAGAGRSQGSVSVSWKVTKDVGAACAAMPVMSGSEFKLLSFRFHVTDIFFYPLPSITTISRDIKHSALHALLFSSKA